MNICACGCGCAISLVVFFLSSLFCASDRSSHNEDIPPQCPPVKAASRSLSRLPRRSARMTTRRTLLLSKGCVNSRGPRRRPSLSLRAAGSKGLLPWPMDARDEESEKGKGAVTRCRALSAHALLSGIRAPREERGHTHTYTHFGACAFVMKKPTVAVDLEAFLRASFPSRRDFFTTEDATRALADYTGASLWETSLAVDMRQSHHTMEQMQTYATRIAGGSRGNGEEGPRMTAMLPGIQDSHGGKEAAWESGDGSVRPLPVKPCVERSRKTCKQFWENGACKFGSRCLYHHLSPSQGHLADPSVTKASVGHCFGIANRCVEELPKPNVSGGPSDLNSKEGKREVLAALPSSVNNYSSSAPRSHSGALRATTAMPREPPKPLGGTACPVSAAFGGVVVVPVLLPDGSICGYAPFPLQMPLVRFPRP